MKQDISIFELLREEEERQTSGLELIASENYVSKQVLDALGSICTNKYAEGYPNARYYGGCEIIDKIEQLPSTVFVRFMGRNMRTSSRTPVLRRTWP